MRTAIVLTIHGFTGELTYLPIRSSCRMRGKVAMFPIEAWFTGTLETWETRNFVLLYFKTLFRVTTKRCWFWLITYETTSPIPIITSKCGKYGAMNCCRSRVEHGKKCFAWFDWLIVHNLRNFLSYGSSPPSIALTPWRSEIQGTRPSVCSHNLF